MYQSTGFLSFVMRRITGLALTAYLIAHIWVIGSALGGPDSFNHRMETVTGPVFTIFEILLLGAVIYHTVDGIRLMIIHRFRVTDYRKSLLYAALAVGFILLVAGGIPMLLFAFEQM